MFYYSKGEGVFLAAWYESRIYLHASERILINANDSLKIWQASEIIKDTTPVLFLFKEKKSRTFVVLDNITLLLIELKKHI